MQSHWNRMLCTGARAERRLGPDGVGMQRSPVQAQAQMQAQPQALAQVRAQIQTPGAGGGLGPHGVLMLSFQVEQRKQHREEIEEEVQGTSESCTKSKRKCTMFTRDLALAQAEVQTQYRAQTLTFGRWTQIQAQRPTRVMRAMHQPLTLPPGAATVRFGRWMHI